MILDILPRLNGAFFLANSSQMRVICERNKLAIADIYPYLCNEQTGLSFEGFILFVSPVREDRACIFCYTRMRGEFTKKVSENPHD